MLADFPPHVQTQVQRILDSAARRILAERLTEEQCGSNIAPNARERETMK